MMVLALTWISTEASAYAILDSKDLTSNSQRQVYLSSYCMYHLSKYDRHDPTLHLARRLHPSLHPPQQELSTAFWEYTVPDFGLF